MAKRFSHLGIILCAFTLFFLAFPPPAQAYLDPGTGSYLIQILIATIVGGLLAVKVYWGKIKAFFTHLLSRRSKNGEP